MTHAPIKFLSVLTVLGLSAVAIGACGGDDVPTGAVAQVGDESITQDEFDKWLKTASMGQAAQGGEVTTPDPPDFKKCAAAKQKQPVPQGQKKPTAGAAKKQCEQEYDALKTEVMQFLIQAAWVQQEAEQQDINVTDAQIKRSFADQKKQAFPTDKAYKEFLTSSGMNEEDILFRVKLDQLQQKLTQKVTQESKKVTDADVQEYYDKNKQRFAQPERRDLLVVLTKTEAEADKAKQALDSGQSWKQVANRYSIDEASKAQGGKQPAVTQGQQEKALDEAIFTADEGKVEGPVKTQFGWEVFQVEKVTKASQQTLEQSKETIKNLLRSQGQQKSLDKFIKDFREEYKDQTECADDYRVAECNNAPKGANKDAAGGAGQGQAPAPQQPQAPPEQPQPQAPPEQPQAPSEQP